jgi:hypothetical protein
MLLLQGCMCMYVSIYGTNETEKNKASAKDAEADSDAADRASSSKGKKKKAIIFWKEFICLSSPITSN